MTPTTNLLAPSFGPADNGVHLIQAEANQVLDNAISNTKDISTTGGSHTITDVEFQSAVIRTTGVLTSNATLVFPTRPQLILIANDCTGAFTLGVKSGTGAAITVAAAARKWLWIKDISGNFEVL